MATIPGKITGSIVNRSNGVTYTSGGGVFADPAQAKLNLLEQISQDRTRADEYAQWQQQNGGKLNWASPEMQGLLTKAQSDPYTKQVLSGWAARNPMFGQDQALKNIGIDHTDYYAKQASFKPTIWGGVQNNPVTPQPPSVVSKPINPATTTASTSNNAAMVDALRQKPVRFEGLGLGLASNPSNQENKGYDLTNLNAKKTPGGLFQSI